VYREYNPVPRDWYISDQYGNIEVSDLSEDEALEILFDLIAMSPEDGWFAAQDAPENGETEEA
jgi:hypothetical protein